MKRTKHLHCDELPPCPNVLGYDPAVWKADICLQRKVKIFTEKNIEHAKRIGSLGVRTIHESTGQEFFETPEADLFGVGTAVEVVLASMGISKREGCKCRHRSLIMDRLGVNWAESHMPHVIDWIIESASERSRFHKVAARFGGASAIVHRAIVRVRTASIAISVANSNQNP